MGQWVLGGPGGTRGVKLSPSVILILCRLATFYIKFVFNNSERENDKYSKASSYSLMLCPSLGNNSCDHPTHEVSQGDEKVHTYKATELVFYPYNITRLYYHLKREISQRDEQ